MSNDYKFPIMMTLNEAHEASGLPKFLIQEKAKSGEIVAIKAGNKILVNMDKLFDYLNM